MFLIVSLIAIQAVSEAPPVDLCDNIVGVQVAVPTGLQAIEGLCVSSEDLVVVEPTPKPAPEAIPGSPSREPSPGTPSPAATPRKPGKQPKPKVALRSSHQVLPDPLFGQPQAVLTLTITNADEKFWCPEILWVWYNGTESVQEGDCPPFEQAAPAEVAYQTFTRSIPMAMPSGQWTIKAKLRKSGKIIATVEVGITVIGGEQ